MKYGYNYFWMKIWKYGYNYFLDEDMDKMKYGYNYFLDEDMVI